ncbi:MAG: hypothetical protein R2697_02760 [Ilumatobacteraceae bacterium]
MARRGGDARGRVIAWYTWLEQGRRIKHVRRRPRRDRSGTPARRRRHRAPALAHFQPSPAPVEAPQEAPTALVRLIEALDPAPAYVLGPRWEFLAWNSAQARLYPRIVELDSHA